MKCKICGNEKFTAHQQAYHDILVDGDNDFIEDMGIYESEHPYGPYCCARCGAEYDELDSKWPLSETQVFRVGPMQDDISKMHLLKAKWVKTKLNSEPASDDGVQTHLDAMTPEEQKSFLEQVDDDAIVALTDEEPHEEAEFTDEQYNLYYDIQRHFDLEELRKGYLRVFFDINTDANMDAAPSEEALEEFAETYGMSFDDFFEKTKEGALQKMLNDVSMASYAAAEDAAAELKAAE